MFVQELELAFENLCRHPEYYASVNDILRRIKINRFPFLVVYEIEKDKVIVVGIRHTSRKPKY